MFYSQAKPGDIIITNGKDNHMSRKLGFAPCEIVKSVKIYESRGLGPLVNIQFESGNGILGKPEIELEIET